eukprot:CAMPEP_0113645480 /NCGR_PEP_ID=MMETSP0017_2-20120614/23977_1 /TAXON_ID=2856 /ORGANISM="Cylindrotheca closterium" /LENGTH=91 /DNA_ID=CAMNT_0000557227 /DNA_START=363 /DNA_END=638 /DNA_ORIENTATION=+ /assembly_acc=CAM_ASM_000147
MNLASLKVHGRTLFVPFTCSSICPSSPLSVELLLLEGVKVSKEPVSFPEDEFVVGMRVLLATVGCAVLTGVGGGEWLWSKISEDDGLGVGG